MNDHHNHPSPSLAQATQAKRDNPDLTFEFVLELLHARLEQQDQVTLFKPSTPEPKSCVNP
jgi:hypothetical protein